ncbi:molybdopterin-dependent oxidoreductase [Thermococcus sp.]|uniref:molybdopterin-dependent oxidoreductase n=1 Tax=Thermococcus sp. TaxID=35749 RepID=UPI0026372DDE|nr:molybdopterin-dependent oxidoreductase [Thermococcus sp.]
MRKEIFGFLVLLLLIGGTYLLARGGKEPKERYNANTTGVIQVTGLVEKPYNMTYSDLRKLPSKNVSAPLYCVDNPRTPRKNGTWRGIPLRILLKKAGVKDNAYKIALYADDGYTTDLLVGWITDDTIVAYEFNGKPIKPRLVVPGMWGYKWIKGIEIIRLVDYDFKGTWERVGYPDYAYTDTEGPEGAK